MSAVDGDRGGGGDTLVLLGLPQRPEAEEVPVDQATTSGERLAFCASATWAWRCSWATLEAN